MNTTLYHAGHAIDLEPFLGNGEINTTIDMLYQYPWQYEGCTYVGNGEFVLRFFTRSGDYPAPSLHPKGIDVPGTGKDIITVLAEIAASNRHWFQIPQLPPQEDCTTCSGVGMVVYQELAATVPCPDCNGSGHAPNRDEYWLGGACFTVDTLRPLRSLPGVLLAPVMGATYAYLRFSGGNGIVLCRKREPLSLRNAEAAA